MTLPLPYLRDGIFSLIPFLLFTNLYNSDQALPSLCNNALRTFSSAFLFAVNNLLDSFSVQLGRNRLVFSYCTLF